MEMIECEICGKEYDPIEESAFNDMCAQCEANTVADDIAADIIK